MKTILVIDDEFAIADVLEDLLSDEGYRVLVARDGKEGMACLAETRPDLVLVDLMMPIMDGREVLRQIRANPDLVGLPVVMMSAACNPATRDSLDTEGFLEKPFNVNVLLALIERVIGAPTKPQTHSPKNP